MLHKLGDFFKNKKVLLLGFGREGKSSLKLLQDLKVASQIGVADQATEIQLPDDITPHLGGNYLESVSDYDIILKSPGISLEASYWEAYEQKTTSQIELFLKFFSGKAIGVTGTKGKTTTTSLLASISKAAGRTTHLLGNIGIPVFDELPSIESTDTVILELSSHQLHHCKYSPPIALLLNLYPEHLDYYESFDEYADAKRNICRYQRESDRSLVHESLKSYIEEINVIGKVDYFSKDKIHKLSIDQKIYQHLPGKHLELNIIAAYMASKVIGISHEDILEGIEKFHLAPHRLEIIGTVGEVRYVNDSAATIPEATIAALEAFPKTSTLIIGGYDRGVNLKLLEEEILKRTSLNVIFLPFTGHQIAEKIQSKNGSENRFHLAENLEDAVVIAKENTRPGTTCLFSPSAASYHQYKNYQERGEEFKQLVLT